MTTAWTVAFVVLSAVVLLLAIVVVGALRRTTNVLVQAEASLRKKSRGLDFGGLSPGASVPGFYVRDPDDRRVSSSDLFKDDLSLVLFMEAECGPCRELAATLTNGSTRPAEPLALMVVMDEAGRKRDYDLPSFARVLYQEGRTASNAFQSIATPQAFVIERGGIVRDRFVPSSVDQLHTFTHRT